MLGLPMRLILAVVLLLVPVCLSAQEKGGKGPPPTPKNLKILTGESGEQVIMTMRAFRTALGVQCTFCHVQGDFASDDNPKKETARMMLTMAREINAKFPDGKRHVSCYTCHRGATEPATEPPATPAQ
jgi:photosynthetic reaction center cytochrome c subunit